MKTLRPAVLVLLLASASAETFEKVTRSFPLGTRKHDIVAREPTATVIPCMVSPMNATLPAECLVLMRRDSQSGFITQLYLVDGRVAAISLARKPLPGSSFDARAETEYLKRTQKVTTFRVLRLDKDGNPIEVEVDQYTYDRPGEVALVVASAEGSEAWLVNTSVFNPTSFFMASTAENREKAAKNKEAIEANKR